MQLQVARALVTSAICLAASAWTASPVQCIEGAPIFSAKCAACHQGGGNVLAPTKGLSRSALERGGYAEVEQVAALVRNGKGQMPKYQV